MEATLEAQLYNTREAITYLEQKHQIKIELNSFYQSARRMHPPPKKIKVGKSLRYEFTQTQLDRMYFVKSSLKRPRPYAFYELKEIHSAEDMDQLKEKYGRIVDGDALIDIIQAEYKVRPSPESIKQRRYRKSIPCVGVSGSRNKTYWYAADYIGGLSFKRHWK